MIELIFKTKFDHYAKYFAFTLAEVLIVIGIIGVVASLTIPQLMQNSQEQQFKSAAKEAYSKAYQAVMQMRAEQGGSLSSYYQSPNTFKPDFIKYFKVINDCGFKNCVSSTTLSDVYKTLFKNNAATTLMDEGQFITADGMFWGIQNSYHSGIQNNLMFTIDVNGYMKNPNVYGRDVFVFQYINENLYPMGAPQSSLQAPTYCKRDAEAMFEGQNFQGYGCMYYVMQGIDY